MVMPPLLNILLNTPWWVFVLFVVLLVFGVRAFRPRSISVWRSLVIPGVFIAWGAVSLIQQMPQSSSYLLADWLVGGVIGAALLWLTGRPMAMRIERAGIVTVAGSPLPLVRNMLIFFAKYGLAVAAARNPAERAHLAIWDVAVSGTSAGYFLAWLAVFVIAYRRASQREQFAPRNQ